MSVFITLALVILKLALGIFVSQETLSGVLFAGLSCQAWSVFFFLCGRREGENCHRRESGTRSLPFGGSWGGHKMGSENNCSI